MSGMVERKPKTAARAWAVAVSAMFLSLAAAPYSAQEPAFAVILDSIKDFGSDPDSDGLYEYLVLKVPLMVERADRYSITAQLSVSGSDTLLSRAGQTLFLETGEQSVKLTFEASALVSLRANQSLAFRVVVSDFAGKAVDARTHLGPTTYSGSMFDGASVTAKPEFTGRVWEMAEGSGTDGRFGYLNLTFEVRNLTARGVQVTGTLNRLVAGTGILRAHVPANLTALAELRFDGGAIRDLGLPGPYGVTVRLVLEPGYELTFEHSTAPYNASDFEPPVAPVAFTGNGTDAGRDKDGDGLFEQLQAQVEVSIALEGAYVFRASLRLPGRLDAVQEVLPRPTDTLDAARRGNYLVTFNISGQLLRMLQLDGPYRLEVDAFSERVLYVTNGTYSTKAYLSSQFEKPRLPARFSGAASVEAVDKDQDGLFDALGLTVPVEADLAGDYQLAGSLRSGDRYVTWAGGRIQLPAGTGKVALRFDGEAIRQAGFDGPYTVTLYLAAQASGRPAIKAYLPPDSLEVQTKAFKASDFEKTPGAGKPLPPPADPEVSIGEDTTIGRAPEITVEVNHSAPDIRFYYTLDDGRSARFRLVFTQLLAYSDTNANGVHDPGEERFQAPLALADWAASKAELTGERGGRVLRYNLTAALDLSAVGRQPGSGQPQARVPQWGRVTFSFTMASRDLVFTRPLAFSLRGGSEMKIDILIEPGRTLPGDVTGLALQHFLSDESGRNFFWTYESDQTRIFRPGSSGANGTIFRSGPSELSKIGLSGANRKEHGYYNWLPQVLVGNGDGSSRYMPVNLTYSTDGRQMALALNYPLPEGTVSLLHDPIVGVNATNAPERIPTVGGRLFNLMLYVLAVGIAVAVVAVIRRSQRNGE